MATVQRFEGPSLDEVLAQVRQALGDDAEIIEANRIKATGVFGSDRYEVRARRAERGVRRPDRVAADAHVNPTGTSASHREAFPGGLDDATVQAAMDHVQQVMADLERKRIAADHAQASGPTSLVDLADHVVDERPHPELESGGPADDPGFAALLAQARANARANAPEPTIVWPELDEAAALADQYSDDDDAAAGTVEWEPLDWSARRVTPVPASDAGTPDEAEEGDAPTESHVMIDDVEAVDEVAVLHSHPGEDDDLSSDSEALSTTLDAGIGETVDNEDPVILEDDDRDGTDHLDGGDLSMPLARDDESGMGEPYPQADHMQLEALHTALMADETPERAHNPNDSMESQHIPTHDVVDDVADDATPDDATPDDAIVMGEGSDSPQPGWVDADREFMGEWTDEAETEEAGWFTTDQPDEDDAAFMSLRNHRLVEWLSRHDLTPEALAQALEGLPRVDDLPPGPGVIIAVVGEGPLVLPLARRITTDLEGDPAKVVLASAHRSHASVPDNCRISCADEAALDRRAWRRRAQVTVVAVDTSTSLAPNAQDWACDVLSALQPHQVIALVDAGRKSEDVARWIADLGGIDAIALSGLEETVSPHAILELGIPVARLGTRVATPGAWSSLLRQRREPVE